MAARKTKHRRRPLPPPSPLLGDKKKYVTPQARAADAEANARWWREAIESVVVAIILALLFRTFEAEAFVIPTGSMAPTLQGRHKDVGCPKCDYRFQAGASEDNEAMKGPVVAAWNCRPWT